MPTSRKSKHTIRTERSNVKNHLWRKKVDKSFFVNNGTTIPRWMAQRWELEKYFPDIKGSLGKRDKASTTEVIFKGSIFPAHLTCTNPSNRKNKVHRLFFQDDLNYVLQEVFLMTHMRVIESQLRDGMGDIEKEIPFWEFMDIEFDKKNKQFIFTDYYKHEPTFPELFKRLVGSPAIKLIADEIKGKEKFRIHKQDWKPREELLTEIGAENVIYFLLDTKNQRIYVGEAQKLIPRLKQYYPSIPNWNYYRYDVLPKTINRQQRVAIERMSIRSFASLLKNKKKIQTHSISEYILANDKIDK